MAETASRRGPATANRNFARTAPPPLKADCALFLDIDGTLLDFAAGPEQVHIDPSVAMLLPVLSQRLGGAVALISGRRIADVERLFPGAGVPIAGQHGVERRRADGSVHKHRHALPGLAQLRQKLTRLAARHEGLLLEDKGATLAMHYRRTPGLASHVHRTLRAYLSEIGAAGAGLHLQPGNRVLEIKPDGRNKGTAVREYLAEPPFAGRIPVFVGDDRTDEYGFAAAAAAGGWGVKVGAGPTHASHRLADVTAVRRWLAHLASH